MRNNITSKKVPLLPWLAAFLGFSHLRGPHSLWCWFFLPPTCSFYLQPSWALGTACPQAHPGHKPAIFQFFFWTNPFPPGAEGVNVCLGPAAEVMQEKVVHRAHGRSITPVISTMSAANEHPSCDGLLTESSCIRGWPPQSCFSVGTRQHPFLRQFGVSILISFSRTKIVLALSEITWTAQKYTIASSGSHWQSCCPGTFSGQGYISNISWATQ